MNLQCCGCREGEQLAQTGFLEWLCESILGKANIKQKGPCGRYQSENTCQADMEIYSFIQGIFSRSLNGLDTRTDDVG